MKTKLTKQKSALQQLREIREKLSKEIVGLSAEELKSYLNKQKTLRPKLPRKKAPAVKP